MELIKVKPPQIALALAAASLALHFAVLHQFMFRYRCLGCGIVLAALGFGLMVWGWSLFRSHSTPIRPTDQPIKLVTARAFRFSRNPMYLGIGAMLFGLALAIGSLPMLVAPIGFLVLMDRVFIPYEEQRLRQTFGSVYEEYQNDVRRWL